MTLAGVRGLHVAPNVPLSAGFSMADHWQYSDDWMNSQPSSRPPAPRSSWLLMVGVWVLVFLVAWNLLRSSRRAPLHNPDYVARVVSPRGDLNSDEQLTIDIFKEASPSVVYIISTEVLRDRFTLDVFQIPRGAGTGFIYDTLGHIVTNHHVAAAGRSWTVTLADHSKWDAEFVGAAPDKDLAVLKINAPPAQLKPLAVGVSKDLQVGQKVLAIGNPFGLDQSLTTGIVSALGREIRSLTDRAIEDVIQTDAAINPGNSGGPLLDSAGRLIGVNTQIASPSGASAGIGFAIPVDTVNRIVPELIRHGRVQRPMLGVVIWPDSVALELGVRGVLLREVQPGSSAEKAGLRGTSFDRSGRPQQLGDLITRIGERNVKDQGDLLDALVQYDVGDEVQVHYIRDGDEHVATVRLQASGAPDRPG